MWPSHSRSWDWLFRFWDAIATPPRDQSPLRVWQNDYCRQFEERPVGFRLHLSVWMDNGRTIWIADAHRGDGKRFVVRADEVLTAFLELEAAICADA